MNTMTLSFNEKIMLDSLLYEASKSDEVKQSKKVSGYVFAGMIAVIGLLMMFFEPILGIAILIVGGLFYLIYPKFASRYYKRYYTTIALGDQYKSSEANTFNVEFNKEYILIKNTQLEAKHSITHFEWISETGENFFIKMNAGNYLIFPKAQVSDPVWLKNYFHSICAEQNIPYHEELTWKWE
ncbi:hypothetical protein [Chryseobacterium sp. BIGb0232]|uniref:hypothetical protein n=1 Tax=Chryseobacterium sp. BIGb0232 TaxID=2940598 RepID=UPI000FBC4A5F|nr:hypothetical protein [Chryseobacterium sp. BIGb0232]MCS4304056.1 hypothetical protein [Chryseobacterium sp. BIGb0232]ROS17639.1 hypothetical protein EDF65_2011 [Chryseobacterium nakagawai]